MWLNFLQALHEALPHYIQKENTEATTNWCYLKDKESLGKYSNLGLMNQIAHSTCCELFNAIQQGIDEDGDANMVPQSSYMINNIEIRFITQQSKSY